MSKTTDPLAWVARAEEDYILASTALSHKPPFRYPGDDPTPDEAQEAQIMPTCRFVRKLLGLK